VLVFDETPPPSLRIGQRVIVQFGDNSGARAKPGA